MAILDKIYGNTDPTLAEKITDLAQTSQSAWGRQILDYLAFAARLEEWLPWTQNQLNLISARWPYLTGDQTDNDPFHAAHLEKLEKAAKQMNRHAITLLKKTYGQGEAGEFADSRFAMPMELLRWAISRMKGRSHQRFPFGG